MPVPAVFISHPGERCGVQQFGRRLFDTLEPSSEIAWRYHECADREQYLAVVRAEAPAIILLNQHPATMPWAGDIERVSEGETLFGVLHEFDQATVDRADAAPLDFLLCADPDLLERNSAVIAAPRFRPDTIPNPPEPPELFTVGSFGFATAGKGFETLCALVNDQFAAARIRINIPVHDSEAMVPPEALAAIVAGCRSAITKPEVRLEITHAFFDDGALLRFLAGNTINAFLYDDAPGRGISSCTDYALASGRPIAISRSRMFRHLHGAQPTIRVEERSLAEIAADGLLSLEPYIRAYAKPAAGARWNDAILQAHRRRRADFNQARRAVAGLSGALYRLHLTAGHEPSAADLAALYRPSAEARDQLAADEVVFLPAGAFSSQTGERKPGRISCAAARAGFHVFGPYRWVAPGRYVARFEFELSQPDLPGGLVLDVVHNGQVLAAVDWVRGEPSVAFTSPGGALEFRMSSAGGGPADRLAFYGVALTCLGLSPVFED